MQTPEERESTGFADRSTASDEQLAAEAAREGSDGVAFTLLVDRHRDRVWRICFRLLGNEHDAHDAAQDVLVKLFLLRGQFAGRSKYSTWVHGIALRTCLTLQRGRSRRQRREQATPTQDAAHEPVSPVGAATGLSLDLQAMLETLDEEDRALVILKYAEDYSFEELAAMFELGVSACKMRASRAREKVQRQFAERRQEG